MSVAQKTAHITSFDFGAEDNPFPFSSAPTDLIQYANKCRQTKQIIMKLDSRKMSFANNNKKKRLQRTETFRHSLGAWNDNRKQTKKHKSYKRHLQIFYLYNGERETERHKPHKQRLLLCDKRESAIKMNSICPRWVQKCHSQDSPPEVSRLHAKSMLCRSFACGPYAWMLCFPTRICGSYAKTRTE